MGVKTRFYFRLALIHLVYLFSEPSRADFGALLARAHLQSTEVQIAETRWRESRAETWSSITNLLPQVSWEGSQNKNNALSSPLSVGQDFEYKQSSLVASWSLFSRSRHLQVSKVFEEKTIYKIQLDRAKAQVDWELRSRYGEYLLALLREKTLSRSLQAGEENVRDTQLRFNLGQRTKIDLLKTQSNLSQLQSQKILASGQIPTRLNKVVEFIGTPREELERSGLVPILESADKIEQEFSQVVRFENRERFLTLIRSLTEEQLEDRISKGSPDYQILLRQREVSETMAKLRSSSEWPELSLRSSFSQIASGWDGVRDSGPEARTFSIVLSVPLFSFGGGVAKLYGSDREIRRAQLESQLSIRQLKSQLWDLRTQALSLVETEASLKSRREQTKELVRLTQKSYQLGQSTSLELLTAQNEERESEFEELKHRLESCVVFFRLRWGLGLHDI